MNSIKEFLFGKSKHELKMSIIFDSYFFKSNHNNFNLHLNLGEYPRGMSYPTKFKKMRETAIASYKAMYDIEPEIV